MLVKVVVLIVALILAAQVLKNAYAYTGCHIVPSLVPNYEGTCQNPGDSRDVCEDGECRDFLIQGSCNMWGWVTICFAATTWDCWVPTLVPTNDPSPAVACSQSIDVPIDCQATDSATGAEVCESSLHPCSLQTGWDEDDADNDIRNNSNNQGVEDIINDWLAGQRRTVGTRHLTCNC